MVRLMAPVLSFTAEEIWGFMPGAGRPQSVFLAGFGDGLPRDDALSAKWDRLLEVRAAVLKALEDARQAGIIGHSLDARVRLGGSDSVARLLAEETAQLPSLFITSQVELVDQLEGLVESPLLPGLRIAVEHARGGKCERCWNYSEAVGSDVAHPGLCERCLAVITSGQT
jgi:isoleucyl-tRNA synthetase